MQEGKKIGMAGGDGRMGAALRVLLRAAEEEGSPLRGAEFALWGAGFRTDGGMAENAAETGRHLVLCADAESAVEALKDAVAAFVGEAEASDDLTLLCLRIKKV